MSNDRIPSVFNIPQKPVKQLPETNNNKSSQENIIPSIIINSNGVNIDTYINNIWTDIENLEKLRRHKYTEKKYSKATTKINELSAKIATELEDIVKQVPSGITKDQIYTVPDKTEIDNLQKTKAERYREIFGVGTAALIGGALFALAGTIPYGIINEPELKFSNEIKSLSRLIPILSGISGAFFFVKYFPKDLSYQSVLQDNSDNRKENAKTLLNFINESYNNGSVDNRVALRVNEILSTGADISSAIRTYQARLEDTKTSLYEKIISSKIISEIGRNSFVTKNKAIIFANILELMKLEKQLGIQKADLDYKIYVADAEKIFIESKDSKEYIDMLRTSVAIVELTDNYINKIVSADEKVKVEKLKDIWMNNVFYSKELVKLENELGKVLYLTKKFAIENEIENKLKNIKISRYENI